MKKQTLIDLLQVVSDLKNDLDQVNSYLQIHGMQLFTKKTLLNYINLLNSVLYSYIALHGDKNKLKTIIDETLRGW